MEKLKILNNTKNTTTLITNQSVITQIMRNRSKSLMYLNRPIRTLMNMIT